MKKFWEVDWRCDKMALLFLPGMTASLGLVGVVMAVAICAAADADTWMCLGTLMALMILLVSMLRYSFTFVTQMSMAVGMGQTRRDYLRYFVLRELLLLAVSYAIALAIHALEIRLYPTLFPGMPEETSVNFVLQPFWICCIISGALALTLLFSVMYAKYGMKAWWGGYIVVIIFPTFLFNVGGELGLLEPLHHIPALVWRLGLPALIAVLLLAGLRGCRRMSVQH